jgi:hypothetical protein
MTQNQFEKLCMNLVQWVRIRAPRDTGNLEDNGVRFEWIDDGTFVIYVDEKIAPYMKYTNENWDLFKAPLHGKKNPNEAWWQDAIRICLEQIQSAYGGEIEK